MVSFSVSFAALQFTLSWHLACFPVFPFVLRAKRFTGGRPMARESEK
jgi:hypothetical protein